MKSAEHQRLLDAKEKKAAWKLWGPYLSERQWGTVREDYSAGGDAWNYLPHDHARSRTYRWGEDGLAGICDDLQRLCFSLALWNGKDAIIKERAFGLTGPEGNHGEDLKEYYFYVDSTPTHSYMKYLYKYPQAAFPYADLINENRNRNGAGFEYELLDTGVFNDNRYFDVFAEYAKTSPTEILIKFTAHNRGPDDAPLHVLPHLWFRNTWSWSDSADNASDDDGSGYGLSVPQIRREKNLKDSVVLRAMHPQRDDYGFLTDVLGDYFFYAEHQDNLPAELMFTDNETNTRRLFKFDNGKTYTKDSINDALTNGDRYRINPEEVGTKVALDYDVVIPAGGSREFRFILTKRKTNEPFADFNKNFELRQKEADEFYDAVQPKDATPDEKLVQRQAFAGMMWSKQFYYYDVQAWIEGDSPKEPPPLSRSKGRNAAWKSLNCADVISMPDKWEYPWFAAWDLAFHCLPIALIDPDFAKDQLSLLVTDAYLNMSGQLPAYEWEFSDLNPPVHAWATWEVYKRDRKFWSEEDEHYTGDRDFLERVYHKLLMNFMWWVNKKDADGSNVFEGGFLGL
ncbi:MAG: glucosidase, partial [Rhizobacter sp.]|nr:glucosidase [Chlorobiales bacterium]